MGKKSGTSWFTIVKRAFRSPSKNDNEKRSSRRREDEFELEEEEKVHNTNITLHSHCQFSTLSKNFQVLRMFSSVCAEKREKEAAFSKDSLY